MRRGRLDGLEGEVGGEPPANEVGDGRGEGVEAVQEGEQEDAAEDSVCLGNGRALLKVDEDRVLGELGGVVSVCVVARGLRAVPPCRAGRCSRGPSSGPARREGAAGCAGRLTLWW